MFDASDQALALRLDELATMETVSPFALAFYRLVLQLLASAPREASGRLAVAGLLDVELRYHREMKQMADQEHVQFSDLRAAGEKHRIGLESVHEFSRRTADDEGLSGAVTQLVVAECCYHLRRTPQVLAALEQALHKGLDEPLVHFALGYNRYVLALETCTAAGEKEGEILVRDPLSFQVQCLQAVGAFENGLTGGEFDAQLYWWIGTVLEAAGLTDAAQDAYDRSAMLFSEGDDDPDREPGGGRRDSGRSGAAITEDELRRAGELLKGKFAPSDIIGPETEDGS